MRGTERLLASTIERRLAALSSHVGAARAGDVTGVHQARVASRRLRELIPLAGAVVPPATVRPARRRLRRLTRALGPVREADVALDLLDRIDASHPDLAPEVALTRAHVQSERESRRHAMLTALRPPQIDAAADAVRVLIGELIADGAGLRKALAARIASRAFSLRQAAEAAGVMYNSEALHAVRIAAKKLRYALEVAHDLRLSRAVRPIEMLKRVQDLLGDLHDRHVLGALAADAISGRSAALEAAEFRFVSMLQGECLRIHAQYLQSRRSLLAVADAAETRIARTVEGSGTHHPRPRPSPAG